MTQTLDALLREIVRQEIARLVREDALTDEAPTVGDDELRVLAQMSANRLRRARGTR